MKRTVWERILIVCSSAYRYSIGLLVRPTGSPPPRFQHPCALPLATPTVPFHSRLVGVNGRRFGSSNLAITQPFCAKHKDVLVKHSLSSPHPPHQLLLPSYLSQETDDHSPGAYASSSSILLLIRLHVLI